MYTNGVGKGGGGGGGGGSHKHYPAFFNHKAEYILNSDGINQYLGSLQTPCG